MGRRRSMSSSLISWYIKTGTWNQTTSSSASDGKYFTCVSPGTNGSTIIRCQFRGIQSITFKCRYQGENSYDYLTVGALDTLCTRSTYGTTLKGTTGTWKEITFTPGDTETHFVEFCYSKDSSQDTAPDNAEIYISSITYAPKALWVVQSGTWNETKSTESFDGRYFTCVSPGSSGSTVLRCIFKGVSSITFKCRYQGENSYDYLTVGSLDTACTRSTYGTSLVGTSGTWKEITFSTSDKQEHFVEFCYSKDGSADTSPDNAEVYILSMS